MNIGLKRFPHLGLGLDLSKSLSYIFKNSPLPKSIVEFSIFKKKISIASQIRSEWFILKPPTKTSLL